jgi:DNA helicase-2/ATP-dependent DNA helicase PcrA
LEELPEDLLEQNVKMKTQGNENIITRNVDIPFPKKNSARLSGNGAGADLEIMDFGLGEKIVHKTFGIGTIIGKKEIREDIELTISFQKSGIKKLSAKYAPIQSMDGK